MQSLESQLAVNPYVMIKLERKDGSITAMNVRAPVKGESLRVTKIARSADPKIFTALLIHSQTGSLAAADLNATERARMAEMGVLLPPEQLSTPVRFSCDLNNLPLEFVPMRTRRADRSPDEMLDLVVSPTLHHLGPEGPTKAMRGHVDLPNVFHPDRSWLRIVDPVTRTPCLYSYPQDLGKELDALRPNHPVPNNVAPEIREWLLEAGIIEPRADAARQRGLCRQRQAAARKTLNENRYAVLRKMLPPLQLAALRRYYRAVIAEGFLPFGDEEWPYRFFAPRDPIAYFYHEQLTDLITKLAGQRVKATFCYFASYHPGSTLPAHRDREQCEWALSLQIDQSPDTETSAWPLYLRPPGADEATPIFTGVGDGTLYYGREVAHHRDVLTTPDYCSFLFLFYVPESFAGSLD